MLAGEIEKACHQGEIYEIMFFLLGEDHNALLDTERGGLKQGIKPLHKLQIGESRHEGANGTMVDSLPTFRMLDDVLGDFKKFFWTLLSAKRGI